MFEIEHRRHDGSFIAGQAYTTAPPSGWQIAARSSEPVHDLLRVGHTALESRLECLLTARKLRFFARFRLVWP
jgi:hypothetical protein